MAHGAAPHGLRARINTDKNERRVRRQERARGGSASPGAIFSYPILFFLIRLNPCTQSVYEVRGPLPYVCTASNLTTASGPKISTGSQAASGGDRNIESPRY